MRPIDIAQQYLAAVYSGDLTSAASRLSPDIELVMGGGGVLSGTHRGRQSFFAAFARMQDITGGTYRLTEQLAWTEDADRAILLASEEAHRGNEHLQFDRVIVYEVANDCITRIRIFEGDPAAAHRAFAD